MHDDAVPAPVERRAEDAGIEGRVPALTVDDQDAHGVPLSVAREPA
jgi:hypothetical protein